MDVLTPDQRSACMRAVRGQDTAPEMRVRRLAHGMGYRYALHKRTLPGVPDLVFPSRRRVIFVHGCFWHKHHCKAGAKIPVTRAEYWEVKRARNSARDRLATRALKRLGWRVLVVWECETKKTDLLVSKLAEFLTDPS